MEPILYSHPAIGAVHVTNIGDSVFVRTSELCEILGYANPKQAVRKHALREHIALVPTSTPGGMQQVSYMNMCSVTRMIVNSKKPNAIKFQEWLFKEVMPAIISTGGYIYKVRTFVEHRCPDLPEEETALLIRLMENVDLLDAGAEEFDTRWYDSVEMAGLLGVSKAEFWDMLIDLEWITILDDPADGEQEFTFNPDILAMFNGDLWQHLKTIDGMPFFTDVVAMKLIGEYQCRNNGVKHNA